jgi:hypothetical protein
LEKDADGEATVEGNVRVLNDRAGFYRFVDATASSPNTLFAQKLD